MKKTKNIMLICCIIAGVLILVLVGFKYGWRMFGFSLCDDPGSVTVTNVAVTDESVRISGISTNSAKSYEGYKAKIEGDTLYVGIKTKTFFAYTQEAVFEIEIPVDTPVAKVVITNSKYETEVYP